MEIEPEKRRQSPRDAPAAVAPSADEAHEHPSLTARIGRVMLTLALAAVIATAGVLVAIGWHTERRALVRSQQEMARGAAARVEAYVDDLLRTMGYVARLRGFTELPTGVQVDLLRALKRHNSAFETIAFFDRDGRLVLEESTDSPSRAVRESRSMAIERPLREGEDFIGPVEIDPLLAAPVMTFSVPVRDAADRVDGVLWARVNLRFLSFVVAQIAVGATGHAYVVDNRGRVVATRGMSPRDATLFATPPLAPRRDAADVERYVGLEGLTVLGASAPIHNLGWRVLVELPLDEARAGLYELLRAMALALVAAVLAAVLLARRLSSSLVSPLQRLTEASLRLRRGALDVTVDVARDDELGVLAATLNQTARQQQQLVHELTRSLDERERAEHEATFIADASALLVESLDGATVLRRLAELIVQRQAEACIVYLVSESRAIEIAAAAHRDPQRDVELRGGPRLWLADDPAALPLREIIARGDACIVSDGAGRHVCAASSIVVPLVAREQPLGAICFGRGVGEFGDDDLRWAREIARRTAATVDNARLYEAAQRAVQTRDAFISVASHELKTPLTSLKLELQLLQDMARSDALRQLPAGEQLRLLTKAERQADRIARLAAQLLDVSAIAGGQLRLDVEEVDLGALVNDVVGRLAPIADRTNTPLQLGGTPSVIGHWDRLRVERVVTNLVENAVKFGAGRPVLVDVSRESDVARLIVRDAGIGIAKKDHARVFERFERAVSQWHYGGLGLGLFISREIVAAHGGDIQLRSEPGAGAEFTVLLPCSMPATVVKAT